MLELRTLISAPTIHTPRLTLRGHRESDLDACYTMWSHPEVTRFIGGRPFSREEVWARLLRYTGHWHYKHYGFWLIEHRATGDFVGEVGFADNKRELSMPMHEIPEMGWALSPAYHGKGLASEAIAAALIWGEANLPGTRTFCIIHPDNTASLHLARKHGYSAPEPITYKTSPTLLLIRDAPSGR